MASANSSNREVMEAFTSFPFATDQGYQNAFSSSVLDNKSEVERENTLLLSRVLYFNKVTGNSITLEDALSFESATRTVNSDRQAEQHQQAPGEEVRTLTFAELKALIEQGKTEGIPNNKVIPNVLNDSPPSGNAGQIRKKPWET